MDDNETDNLASNREEILELKEKLKITTKRLHIVMDLLEGILDSNGNLLSDGNWEREASFYEILQDKKKETDF